jgi:hypothetical protein
MKGVFDTVQLSAGKEGKTGNPAKVLPVSGYQWKVPDQGCSGDQGVLLLKVGILAT